MAKQIAIPNPSEPVAQIDVRGQRHSGLLSIVWRAFFADLLNQVRREQRPGAIVYLPNGSSDTGYLEADGSAVSRTTYASLFAVVGTDYGTGDGSTTFNLPDVAVISPTSGPDIKAYVKV